MNEQQKLAEAVKLCQDMLSRIKGIASREPYRNATVSFHPVEISGLENRVQRLISSNQS